MIIDTELFEKRSEAWYALAEKIAHQEYKLAIKNKLI